MQRGEISLGYSGVAFRGAVATLLLGVYLNTYLEFAYLLWKDGASAAAGRKVNTSQTVYKVYVYKGNITFKVGISKSRYTILE